MQYRAQVANDSLSRMRLGQPEQATATLTKAQKKNAAKKRAKQAQQEAAAGEHIDTAVVEEPVSNSSVPTDAPVASALSVEEKELRKPNKKLRDIHKIQRASDAVLYSNSILLFSRLCARALHWMRLSKQSWQLVQS